MTAEKLDRATRLLKKARSYCKKSVLAFRFSPDWEKAFDTYEQACALLRTAGDLPLYVEALTELAHAAQNANSAHAAAKAMEQAALAALKSKDDKLKKQVVGMYEQASAFYRENHQNDKAANVLVSACRVLGDDDEDSTVQLFVCAVEIFEDEDRGVFSNDTFKTAVQYMCRKDRFSDCLSMLVRQNKIYLKNADTFQPYYNRNGLAVVICGLRMTDPEDDGFARASQVLGEMTAESPEFSTSEEHQLADQILGAHAAGDVEELQKLLKSTLLVHSLDTQVVRAAKKISAPSQQKRQAQTAAAVGNDGDEKQSDDFLC